MYDRIRRIIQIMQLFEKYLFKNLLLKNILYDT